MSTPPLALSATARPRHPASVARGPARAAADRQHERVLRRYRQRAGTYDRAYARYTAWSVRHVLASLPEAPAGRILDLACGTGGVTRALRRRHPGAGIVGADLSPDMLAVARAGLDDPGVEFVAAPAERLPFRAEEFDLVVCANAFHLVGDQRAALLEMQRVLRPGGHLVLLDWTRESLPMRLLWLWLAATQRTRRRLLCTRSLPRLAREAGLRVDAVRRVRIPPAWGLMTLLAVRAAT